MFSKKIINATLFILIVVIGFTLYFYKLDTIPRGFYIDEALPGYNAFSILKTGKDEYGKFLPMFLRFYGSYNPPLFTYLTIPSVALFGLNVFAVRFVSALAGLLVAIPLWLLLRSSMMIKSKQTALFTVLLMTMSPWLLLHSRVGYEVSLAFLLFTTGVYFSWKGLKDPKKLLISFLFLSLSTYAAYAERFLVPMYVITYLVVFRKYLRNSKTQNYLKKAVSVTLVTQIPHILLLSTPAFLPKGNEIASSAVISQAQKIILLPHQISLILAQLREFLSQYVTYFSPRSLFFLPDPDIQRSIPDLSALYFWMVIPYLVGLYVLWKKRNTTYSKLIIILMFLSPIPAALTKDPFATHRAMPHLLPIILVIGLGIDSLFSLRSKNVWKITFGFLTLFSLVLLWRSYFVLLPNERSVSWGYGDKQLVEETSKRPNDTFVIDQSRKKPTYIKLLFFLEYPPDKYQNELGNMLVDDYYHDIEFDHELSFANAELRSIKWEEDIYKDQILVGDSLVISEAQAEEHSLTKLFEIKSSIDEVVWLGFETNPNLKCAKDQRSPNCEAYRK